MPDLKKHQYFEMPFFFFLIATVFPIALLIGYILGVARLGFKKGMNLAVEA